MKPDWKDAPEWANYLAMDVDGEWFWFEKEPFLSSIVWMPRCNEGRREFCGKDALSDELRDIDFRKSLEARPK